MKRCYGCMEEYPDDLQICPHCGYQVKMMEKETFYLNTGTVLNERFIVGRVLGYGGFGVTYIGFDLLLKKKVALKEYLPSGLVTRFPDQSEVTVFSGEKEELFKRGKDSFIDEAQRLAMFNSKDGIITVYDQFEANGTAYLVMDYFEGETVAKKVSRDGPFTSKEVIKIIDPLLAALQEIHNHGIIHRDIAPDNIYLTTEGKVKLLDFGAARSAALNSYSQTSISLSIIIKRGYAPLEQYRCNGAQGPWSDVYALGATMYYMLTGLTPIDAMERVQHDDFKQPKDIVNDIDLNLNNAIMNALIVDVRQRTPSVDILKKEINSLKRTRLKRLHPLRFQSFSKPVKLLISFGSCLLLAFTSLGIIDYVDKSNRLAQGSNKVLASNQTYSPGLLNTDLDNAIKLAKDAGLALQIIDKIEDEEISENRIIKQDPLPGVVLTKNSNIKVVVSRGKDKILVPDVTYMYERNAKEQLEALGFKVKIKKKSYDNIADGAVVKQSVKANTSECLGKTITLTVVKNKTVPHGDGKAVDITNCKLEDAIKQLYRHGLYVVVNSRTVDDTIARGTIISQSITNDLLADGSIIEVVVSGGESQVVVPDVEFKDEIEAVDKLNSLGFHVITKYQNHPFVAKQKVISQSIDINSVVKQGSQIILEICQGSDMIENTTGDVETITKTWSDWTIDSSLKNNDNYVVESKVQYAAYKTIIESGTVPKEKPGYNLINTVDTGQVTPWTSWSDYISGTPPADSRTERFSKVETQYKYFRYVCGTCDDGWCYPWPGYTCVDGIANQYREMLLWNQPADNFYTYTLKMQNGLTHEAIQDVKEDGRKEDWFFDRNLYEIAHRYRKQTCQVIYNYYYKSNTLSEWQDQVIKPDNYNEVVSRVVYRYKAK